MPGVSGQRVAHGIDDVGKGVEPHHVGGAKGRAARAPDQRSGQRIHRVEADAEPLGMVDRGKQREHTDAVGDEVGRVPGADHALAQRGNEEAFEAIQNIHLGCGARYQFHQVHIARRVEEVHAAESLPEFLRQRF